MCSALIGTLRLHRANSHISLVLITTASIPLGRGPFLIAPGPGPAYDVPSAHYSALPIDSCDWRRDASLFWRLPHVPYQIVDAFGGRPVRIAALFQRGAQWVMAAHAAKNRIQQMKQKSGNGGYG